LKSFTLRKIRIVVSIFFLILFAAVFLDIHHSLPSEVINYFVYLQFVPSIFKFFNTYTLLASGFIIVLLFVLLFGRVYCSSVCPVGTIQDISSNISKRISKGKYYSFSGEFKWLRYTVLLITVLLIFAGNLFLLNLLDPYSNAGRIFAQLINPMLIAGNNFISSVLVSFDIYTVYPVDPKSYSYLLALFPAVFLVVILYLSFKRGRLYCNTICPVGTFLGLFAKLSLFKLKIEKTECEGCGVCETVCKAECINFNTKEIDESRCVSCYNCIDVCPSEVISYTNSWKDSNKSSEEKDSTKREFFSKTFFYVLGLTGISLSQIKVIPEKESTVPVHRKLNVSPPGSTSLDHYNSACTACHLCITACPTKVLQPSFLEFGFLGILQPFMDFKTSFCNYDCVVCLDVCPTGAIKTLTPEKKKTVQIGKAIFVKENCIVETEKKACGACSEHCPTKAVDMVFFKDELKIPEVTEKYCVGCGACEFACPTFPYKAIYIEGNSIHKKAEKRKLEQIEFQFDPEEDFPF
jgi:ferredoxin